MAQQVVNTSVTQCSFGGTPGTSNPEVAAATAAKLGAFNAIPCVPMTPAPWVPGAPTVLIGSMPALDSVSKCMCTWGGIIQIVVPGCLTVEVP